MRKYTPVLFLLFLFPFQALAEIPPILDYYPGCDYQELGEVTSTGIVEKNNPALHDRSIQTVLKRLQAKAAEKGADALIITDLKVDTRKLFNDRAEDKSIYRYTAEAIRVCDPEDTSHRKLADFDAQGNRHARVMNLHQTRSAKTIELDVNKAVSLFDGHVITQKQWEKRPVPTSTDIDVNGSVYGVKLGSNRQQVIQALGYPSAEFRIFQKTNSMTYGKRLWLHFQHQKLVRVDFTDHFLSYDMLNQIPALDGFDDFNWRISGKAKVNSPLDKVREALSFTGRLDDNNRMEVSQGDNQLTLQFNIAHEQSDVERHFFLVGFSLQKKGVALVPTKLRLDQQAYQGLAKIMRTLQQQKDAHVSAWIQSLGKPVGRIFMTRQRQLDIYDNHLAIQRSAQAFSRLLFEEDTFPLAKFNGTHWRITADIYQGQTLAGLREHLGPQIKMDYGEVAISSAKYDMSVYLQGEGSKAAIYGAKLVLY